MQTVLMILLLIVAIALIGVILIQQGKGAEMGASFGAGASGTVFGAPGSGNFLTRATTVLAVIFFGVALALAYLYAQPVADTDNDIFNAAAEEEQAAPAEGTDILSELPASQDSDLPVAEEATDEATESEELMTDEESSEEPVPEEDDQ